MFEAFVAAGILIAIMLIFAALLGWWGRWSDYQAGRRAHEDGVPLGARWPRRMRDGWNDAWGERLRARLGYRQHRG